MTDTEKQLRSEIARLKLEREELLAILADCEIITKTHRKMLYDADLIERIESALERSEG